MNASTIKGLLLGFTLPAMFENSIEIAKLLGECKLKEFKISQVA